MCIRAVLTSSYVYESRTYLFIYLQDIYILKSVYMYCTHIHMYASTSTHTHTCRILVRVHILEPVPTLAFVLAIAVMLYLILVRVLYLHCLWYVKMEGGACRRGLRCGAESS